MNVIRYVNSTGANNTCINLTNSMFEEFGSNFPNNSVVSNRTIYHLMFQSPYVRNGTVRTINFTTLEVIHKNIFVVIMESGIFSSGALVLGILNWEVNANRA